MGRKFGISNSGSAEPKATVHGVSLPDQNDGVPFTNTMPLSRKALLNKVVVKRRAYLELDAPGKVAQDIELGDSQARMGRSPECEIQLVLENISRIHARIVFRDEEYVLEDLHSTNGSHVNGIQVTRCILRDGDLIEIGEAKLHFFEEKVRQR